MNFQTNLIFRSKISEITNKLQLAQHPLYYHNHLPPYYFSDTIHGALFGFENAALITISGMLVLSVIMDIENRNFDLKLNESQNFSLISSSATIVLISTLAPELIKLIYSEEEYSPIYYASSAIISSFVTSYTCSTITAKLDKYCRDNIGIGIGSLTGIMGIIGALDHLLIDYSSIHVNHSLDNLLNDQSNII